jgi:hypothetical protein
MISESKIEYPYRWENFVPAFVELVPRDWDELVKDLNR